MMVKLIAFKEKKENMNKNKNKKPIIIKQTNKQTKINQQK
jgi:hypothetical protein